MAQMFLVLIKIPFFPPLVAHALSVVSNQSYKGSAVGAGKMAMLVKCLLTGT